jgi:hypothetical protein
VRNAKSLIPAWLLFAVALMILGCVFVRPRPAAAQTIPPCNKGQGFNGAYGQCQNGSPNGSFDMIDASAYAGQMDICSAINTIFTNYSATTYGIVVDARGFKPGLTQSCPASSPNPWPTISNINFTNVVLLPPGTITLNGTWTLPQHTRLVGQGPSATVLQAGSTFPKARMIEMGNDSICPPPDPGSVSHDCPTVQIEHLEINGSNRNISGIYNANSQEKSYVNDVMFTNLGNIALDIETPGTFNSGPYTNLTMTNVGTCLKIMSNPTRGVHGVTCSTNTSGLSSAAIYVDGINNSLEDVYIQGGSPSQDGILIGSQAPAANNLLFNVSGSGLRGKISEGEPLACSAASSPGRSIVAPHRASVRMTPSRWPFSVLRQDQPAVQKENP